MLMTWSAPDDHRQWSEGISV